MNPTQEHRSEALAAALATLDKRYGRGTLMRLGDAAAQPAETVSTGCLSIDLALGVGGLAKGRVIEVYGQEASGKTTLALQAIAQVQAAGGTAAFVDAEHALDSAYAAKLGVQLDDLLVSQPDNGEQALEITETLVRSGAVDMVVIDSVAALTPRAELEGEMGDAHVGLQARLMSQALRKITAIAARSNCIVLFINQLRQKIGVTFGNGEVTTGGNALKFYASMRIEVKRIGSIKNKDGDTTGSRTRVRVMKNKLAPPFKTVEVDIIYGRGFCRAADLIDLADKNGLLKKSGSWMALGDERLGNGREAVRERLYAEPELFERLRTAVATHLTPEVPTATAEVAVA